MEQTTYKKPKVLVTVLHQGWIRPEFSLWHTAMKNDIRACVDVEYISNKPSENNRNFSVRMALDGGYDYLISIDHDNPPLKNPIDLALMNLDVIGFAVPQWNMSDPKFPIYFVSMDRVENGYIEHQNRNGLQEVDAVGSGLMCISKKVMESVEEPFVRKWKDGFAITGLDFYFCEKVKEKGFKIYCHYGYLCNHFKEVNLLDVLNFKLNGR